MNGFSAVMWFEALTDTVNIRDYIKKMRKRDRDLDTTGGQIVSVEMIAKDGKKTRKEITSS